MLSVFVDEAGYNGGNLLDVEQPWLALAAVPIPEGEASQLMERYLPVAFKSGEVKHCKLYGCEKNDAGLVAVQRASYEDWNASVYLINKRMACCESFVLDCVVDVLPEMIPGSTKYVQLIRYLYSLSERDVAFEQLLKRYVSFSCGEREGEAGFLASFSDQTDQVAMAICERLWRDPITISLIDRTSTVTGLVDGMLMELIRVIGNKLDEEYEVIYDKSDEIRAFARPFMEQVQKARNEKPFSILKDMKEGDSHESRGLQVADVLAGGGVRYAMEICGLERGHENRCRYGRLVSRMLSEITRKDALLFKFDKGEGDYSSLVKDVYDFWLR